MRAPGSIDSSSSYDETSGASSGIALSLGNNTITLVSTSQDGSASSTYTVIVRRQSNVSTLSGLSVSAGTLSPVFSSSTTSYAGSLSNSTASLTVAPTATHSGASLKVNGTTDTSGNASGSISLSLGMNVISVVVRFDMTICSTSSSFEDGFDSGFESDALFEVEMDGLGHETAPFW